MFTCRQNPHVIYEIGVGEHDGDVRFLTGSRNMSVSRMRNKNMQFGPYFWPNRQNSFISYEIGVGEHEGDVRFSTGSRNIGVLRIRNENMQFGP